MGKRGVWVPAREHTAVLQAASLLPPTSLPSALMLQHLPQRRIPEASPTCEKAGKNPAWTISHLWIEFPLRMGAAQGVYDLAEQAMWF